LVNAICPGFTTTELSASILSKKEIEELTSKIPLGRFADVSEIAKIAVTLCSELNTYLTGQTIVIDGGVTIE
jgi:3-oxoacyl-[acyl-carrier protein] reductase